MTDLRPQNPYAPPQARVEDVRDPTAPMELAGRSARLGAVVLDTILQAAIVLPIMYALGWWKEDPNLAESVRDAAFGFVVFVALNGVLLARHGQTIGKRLLGLRIVRTDCGQVGVARMLGLRYGVGWLVVAQPELFIGIAFALLDSLLIFRQSRKCLHDNIADTIVIKA